MKNLLAAALVLIIGSIILSQSPIPAESGQTVPLDSPVDWHGGG